MISSKSRSCSPRELVFTLDQDSAGYKIAGFRKNLKSRVLAASGYSKNAVSLTPAKLNVRSRFADAESCQSAFGQFRPWGVCEADVPDGVRSGQ
jgi:hypothetical protein